MLRLLIKGLGAFVGYLLANVLKNSLKDQLKELDPMYVGMISGVALFLLGWFVGKKISGLGGEALEGLAIGGVVVVASEVYNYVVTKAKE